MGKQKGLVLHTHPQLESKSGLSAEHVIVDRPELEEIRDRVKDYELCSPVNYEAEGGMTVEAAKRIKKDLEDLLSTHIKEFEEATGFMVKNILILFQTDDPNKPYPAANSRVQGLQLVITV